MLFLPLAVRARLVLCASLVTALPIVAQNGGYRLFTVASTDPYLRIVDAATAQTLVATMITVAGGGATVQNAKGLAVHPLTGELWALLYVSSQRKLAKINPVTAVATLIGNTGDNFAGIAFDLGGTLYGVTGDGATVPETLYTLNQTTAAPTFFMTLGNGNDGETIALDPLTNRLYHASGLTVVVLETIDLANRTVTNVPLSGSSYQEALTMTHWVGRGFLLADNAAILFVVSSAGAVSRIGMLDHNAKGLAFVSTTNVAAFRPYGDGCLAQGGYLPILTGSGAPAWSSPVTLRVLDGPGGASGALAFGIGTGIVPIGPGCSVQILPIVGSPLAITLTGIGSGNGTASLPLQIPPGLGTVDLYLQTALLDGSGVVLTNPLHVHVQ